MLLLGLPSACHVGVAMGVPVGDGSKSLNNCKAEIMAAFVVVRKVLVNAFHHFVLILFNLVACQRIVNYILSQPFDKPPCVVEV